VPFGRAALVAYRFPSWEDAALRAGSPPARPAARSLRTAGYGLLVGAVVAAAASGGFRLASNSAYDSYQRAQTADERERWRQRTRTFDWGTTVSAAAALVAAGTGVGLLLYDRSHERTLSLGLGPGTFQARVDF
jgi:hypothetical protein